MSAFVWHSGALLVAAQLTSPNSSIAASIGAELTAAASLVETIPATIAATLDSELTAAITASESIPGTIAAAFGDELTASVVVTETIPTTISATLTSELTSALTANEVIPATIAAAFGGELGAALLAEESIPATVDAAIGDELTAEMILGETIDALVAAGFGNELTAAIAVQAGALFVPPVVGNQRVAKVSRDSGWPKPFPVKDPDSTLRYYWDWREWLANEGCGPILGFEVTIEGEDGALVRSIPIQGEGQWAGVIQTWITGGTEGTQYSGTCRIFAEDDTVEDDTRTIYVSSH